MTIYKKIRFIAFLLLVGFAATGIRFCCETKFDNYVTPSSGQVIQIPEATLQWRAHHTCNAYLYFMVYFGPSGGQMNLIHTSRAYSPDEMDVEGVWPSYHVTGLEPGNTYNWSVRAIVDGGGNDDNGGVTHFHTADIFVEPGYVYDPWPDSAAIDVDSITMIACDVYNPNDETYLVDFYLGTTPDPPLYAEGLAEVSWSDNNFRIEDPDTLAGGTRYYFRAVARSDTETNVGPLWYFTTVGSSGASVDNPSPSHEAFDVDSIVNFSWELNNPSGATYTYDFYLGTAADPPLFEADLSDPVHGPDTLNGGTTYYWKVVANSSLETIESPVWRFNTLYHIAAQVYAKITLESGNPSDPDRIIARFDSELAPDGPINPLEATAVTCNAYTLWWDSFFNQHVYDEYPDYLFLENGLDYDFAVTAGQGVPALNQSITFPECAPRLTYPLAFDHVSKTGFPVSWSGGCAGDVYFMIVTWDSIGFPDTTDIWIQSPDTGWYDFTPSDLAPLGDFTGRIELILIKQVQEGIASAGYRSEGIIRAREYSVSGSVYVDP